MESKSGVNLAFLMERSLWEQHCLVLAGLNKVAVFILDL